MTSQPSCSNEDPIIQRLKFNDPTLTFLLIGPATCTQQDTLSIGEIAGLDLFELILLFLRSGVTKGSFVSALAVHGIFEPCFCENWPGEGFCEALASNAVITCLVVYACCLGFEQGMSFGRSLATNSTLQTLVVRWFMASGWELGLTAGLAGNSALTCVSIQDSSIFNSGGKRFGEVLAVNSTLTCLDLSCNSIWSDGAAGIGEGLAVNSTLVSLNLGMNRIGEGAMKIGEALVVNSTLTELGLIANQLTGTVGEKIGEGLAANHALLTLNLSYNPIGDAAGVRIGEALALNSTLTKLDISFSRIEDGGAAMIGGALASNSSLTALQLGSNLIGENGVGRIGDGLAFNSTLTSLDLSKNMIGKNGGARIDEGMASNCSLTRLNVRDASFGGWKLYDWLVRNQHNARRKSCSLFEMLLPWLSYF